MEGAPAEQVPIRVDFLLARFVFVEHKCIILHIVVLLHVLVILVFIHRRAFFAWRRDTTSTAPCWLFLFFVLVLYGRAFVPRR